MFPGGKGIEAHPLLLHDPYDNTEEQLNVDHYCCDQAKAVVRPLHSPRRSHPRSAQDGKYEDQDDEVAPTGVGFVEDGGHVHVRAS